MTDPRDKYRHIVDLGTSDGRTLRERLDRAVELRRATERQSPMAEEQELQKRLMHCRRINAGMTISDLQRRFGIGKDRIKQLLTGDPAYPKVYRLIAKHIGRPLSEVAEKKELGLDFCKHCVEWFPRSQFHRSPGRTSVHSRRSCDSAPDVGKKD